jgi:hypothetical protein
MFEVMCIFARVGIGRLFERLDPFKHGFPAKMAIAVENGPTVNP